jgi:riboflavin synthase
MFTGIIAAVGTAAGISRQGGDMRLTVAAGGLELDDITPGDSILVNGVCLTVVEKGPGGFTVDVSAETLSCTTFDALKEGSRLNLEKAMAAGGRFNGHLVSGHVDGTGTVVSIEAAGASTRYLVELPQELSRYACDKGSICLDGVSLTVNRVEKNRISVNIIPHTAAQTIFGDYRPGTRVNIEVDMIARYLERLIR